MKKTKKFYLAFGASAKAIIIVRRILIYFNVIEIAIQITLVIQ